ncbi:MAG: hypothetical protein DYH12_35965 [Sorangiineae bacterium PRO1]|nr:hypothetical protein [Sorangiineae bacterium PRO1]
MRSKSPECLMNAGYSAGWCQVSYGVELRAEELLCRARGDDRCFFVMATPGRMPRVLRDYQQRLGL